MDPRVSFVVPCYNYAHFVAHAVDSLLNQTFAELEVIIVDDASTDDSHQVIERYARDPRVRIIHHPENRGHIHSYNEGLVLARGEFLGLVSADDFAVQPDAVARQVAIFDAHPSVGFVYTACAFADGNGHIDHIKRPWTGDYVRSGLEEFVSLLGENYVPASGTLVRKTCHARVGYYDPGLPHTGDWDLWLRLAARFDVGYIDAGLYAYRMHDTNMHRSVITPHQSNTEHVAAVQRAFQSLPPTTPPAVRKLRRAALQQAWLRSTAIDCSSGRTRRSWKDLADAIYRAPDLLAARSLYATLTKVLVSSVLGHDVYWRLAAKRASWRKRQPVPSPR
jgi:hypothetical protein